MHFCDDSVFVFFISREHEHDSDSAKCCMKREIKLIFDNFIFLHTVLRGKAGNGWPGQMISNLAKV